MSKRMFGVLAALILLAASNLAPAHEAGDWLVRFGFTNADPKSDYHPVVSVNGARSPTFNVAYMFTQNWSFELLAAYPFKHDISLVGGPNFAETKHLPPTVSVQYHFLPTAKFQPYVGLGVNYTTFFSEKTFGAFEGTDLGTVKIDPWVYGLNLGFMF